MNKCFTKRTGMYMPGSLHRSSHDTNTAINHKNMGSGQGMEGISLDLAISHVLYDDFQLYLDSFLSITIYLYSLPSNVTKLEKNAGKEKTQQKICCYKKNGVT